MANDLGEYKVVVSADFSELQGAMSGVTDILTQSMKDISSQMENAGKAATEGLKPINEQIQKISDMSGQLGNVNKQVESVGNAAKGAASEVEGLNTSFNKMGGASAVVGGIRSQFGLLDGVVSKLYSHLQWVAAAAVLVMPAMAVKNIASVEQQMAGMIQTLPQLHNNQALVNQTAKEFITIAEQYGMSVDKIIEAGRRKLAA